LRLRFFKKVITIVIDVFDLCVRPLASSIFSPFSSLFCFARRAGQTRQGKK